MSLEEFQDAVGEFYQGEVVGGVFCNDMLANFDRAPVEYRAVVALIMLREQALLRFARFEIIGETEYSLRDVNAQLRWPRPIPVRLGNA